MMFKLKIVTKSLKLLIQISNNLFLLETPKTDAVNSKKSSKIVFKYF